MPRIHPAGALAAALFACAAASGQSVTDRPSFSATPQELRDAFKDLHVKADTAVVVLLEEGQFTFDAQGAFAFRHHLIFKVLTREGAQNWDTIERSWAPWHEQRPEIRARVITPDGSVRELDQKTIADAPARQDQDVLSDERTVKAPLPAMEQGSIVEQEVSTREIAPLSPTGNTCYFYFGSPAPIQRTRLTAYAPPGVQLRHEVRLLPGLSMSTRQPGGGGTEYVFEHGPLEALKETPPFLPPETPFRPHIVFSTGLDWHEVASDYSHIVDRQIAGWRADGYLPKFGAKTDREGKILAILGKVNTEIRYTGIEFGEASIVPRSPAEVLERKYGDCKDKSTLVVALLRAAGIEAHVALLFSSTGSDIEPDLPGMDVFNHAIVYVPGTPDLWLDPTDPNLRLGVLAPQNQGRLALVASEKTTSLVRTPESTSAENRVVETREFYLSELGPARIVETSKTYGTADRNYREQWGHVEPEKVKEGLKDYADWAYAAPGVTSASHSDAEDLTQPFQLRLEFKDAKRGTTAPAEAAVAIRLSQAGVRLPEFFRTEPKDTAKKDDDKEPESRRTADFVIPEAFISEWQYHIVPPPGFRVRQLPEQSDEKLGPASLSMRFQTEADGVVTGTVKFDMPKRRFTAAEGFALRDAMLALQKKSMPLVYFDQIGETLLASGKVKEALAAFRDLEKLHPTEALHCYPLARALLAAGAGEAARAEARRGTELEPKSAKAYANLASILRHDLVGRDLRKGYDRAGAIEAYRKALELDPTNDEVRANLAILLEYDDAGRRYAAGAQLTEAIAEYRKIEDKLAKLGIAQNLAFAMFRAGRMKELLGYLHKQPDTDINRALKLAAIAVLDGPAKAIEGVGREISGVEQQQKALLAAGRNLFVARRYEAAADLLVAGAAQAPNPAALRNYAELVRHTRRTEDLSPRGDRPEDAVTQYLLALRDLNDGKQPVWKSVFSRYVSAPPDSDDLEGVQARLGLDHASLERAGIDFATGVDVAVALMQLSAEGNDDTGFKLRTTLPGTGSVTFYVVREDGEYRLLGAFGRRDGVARLVLALEKSGQLDAARKWLDWAREDMEPGPAQDPLSPPEFVRVWAKGQNGGSAEIKNAAAVILASSESEAIPLLRQAVQTAQKIEEKRALAFVLAGTYIDAKDYTKAAELSRNLLQEVPDSVMAFRMAVEAVRCSGDLPGTERLIAENLDRLGSDPMALRAAALALSSLGANDRASAVLARLVSSGKAEAQDYNSIAWNDLLGGSITPATDAAIRQAMLLSNGTEHHILHTLAAIQAEEGKANEARATLLQRIESEASREPNSDDWYVFGRIFPLVVSGL
jgi:tetratricopeptide (TPR) repeat protein